IESLHQASPPFLEALAAMALLVEDRPVMVLATTRPGLDLPGSWTQLASRSTLLLGPLTDAQMRSLLGSVLLDAVSDASRGRVLERSAGNPLFAIEFARMIAESGADERDTPVSLNAVISARLDAIRPEIRSLALDSAVLGDEVWPEALATMADAPIPEVRAATDELTRRGVLVRRHSSLPEFDAYRFSHALIREVAYGRLPRSVRARRHLAAALWLEEAVGDRADEWAESLSRNYATAFELANASDEPETMERASGPAVHWLIAAGERASPADPSTAFAAFDRGMAIAPEGSPERAEALWRSASAGRRAGSLDAQEVLARHRAAFEIARAHRDDVATGEALTRIGNQLGAMGEGDRARIALAGA